MEEYKKGYMKEFKKEKELLTSQKDMYGIYQLKENEDLREYRFESLEYLRKKDLQVSKEHYSLIYTGELEEGTSLNRIYEQFNLGHLEDFKGHFLSVSDIILIHQAGSNHAYYVDRFGFEELEKFSKEYRPFAKVEELEEQNYNMVDNVLNNGCEKFMREEEKQKTTLSIKDQLEKKKKKIVVRGIHQKEQINQKCLEREL